MPGKSFAAAVTRASSDACKVLATEHLRACGLSAAWNIAYWGVRARSTTLAHCVWLLKQSSLVILLRAVRIGGEEMSTSQVTALSRRRQREYLSDATDVPCIARLRVCQGVSGKPVLLRPEALSELRRVV